MQLAVRIQLILCSNRAQKRRLLNGRGFPSEFVQYAPNGRVELRGFARKTGW